MNQSVQTPAQDTTRGPVGLSGTVQRTRIERTTAHRVAFTAVIVCGAIRCHIVQLFDVDDMQKALDAQRTLPAGANLTAFGSAPDLQLVQGELHLVATRVITYQLLPEEQVAEPDLFATT